MSIIMELFKRSQAKSTMLDDNDFWEIIDCVDHEYGGDSEAVISSLIRHLKNCEDDYIFAFDDKLSEFIYALDGKCWADGLFGNEEFSEDKFLSARCAAIAGGKNHYFAIVDHKAELDADSLHFHHGRWYACTDGLLTAAKIAWSRKHLEDISKYPHNTKYPTKSHSNEDMWK
ncbi:MAG: DUF4240 domain-containing protein [Oscillospiraceae bacterium]|nr:DUF4240 domain-containing protein [Oscillospiraceae bacterium]